MEILNILSILKNAIDGLAYCNSHTQAYEIKFLLDTCALQANYRSEACFEKLQGQGSFQKCCHTVCFAINGGICETSRGILTFNLKYLKFCTNKYDSISVGARILELELCDLIIGLPTINQYSDEFWPSLYRN